MKRSSTIAVSVSKGTMGGHKTSYNTSTKVYYSRFQVNVSKDVPSEVPDEEPIEETVVEYVSGSDDSGEPEEQPEEDGEEDPEEVPEEDEDKDPEEDPEEDEEDLEEESSVEPDEESTEESKVSFQSGVDGTDHQSGCNQNHSKENNRPLDATASYSNGETGEGNETSKRCSSWEAYPEQDESVSKPQEHSGSSGKRRRSRWDAQPEQDGDTSEGNETSKRRKTRWASDVSHLKILGPLQLPDFVKDFTESVSDPEIQKLKVRLSDINSKLLSPELHDDRPEKERSISPKPVYNNLGLRINTREVRLREKLIKQRQRVISKLIKKNPTFKAPPDYKPLKLFKKLYIPVKAYPTYNFIGLIMGPRGNTQKKLEQETGAKILLRGKGSKAPNKPDISDGDDLHVLIKAETQFSLDAAVKMVEKLLIPVDEGMNDHKRAQLEELAKMNGTYRGENVCSVCKEVGHKQYACPRQKSTFKMAIACEKCGSLCHFTPSCPLIASPQVGNSLSASSGLGGGSNPIPSTKAKPNREISNSKLYVGYLPQSVDENRLRELFCLFGKIIDVKVIKDRNTGLSKGYGFVNFESSGDAAMAVTHMNGHKMEGKMLAVRVAGCPPPAGTLSVMNHLPMYPGPLAAIPAVGPSQTTWPGPPGSMLPEAQVSYPKNEGLGWPSSISSGHSSLLPESKAVDILPSSVSSHTSSKLASSLESVYRYPNQIPVQSPALPSQFPGAPDYPGSQLLLYSATPTLKPSPPLYFSQTPDGSSNPYWPRSQLPW
ncbi:Branchpoint-bridging protein [Actinidia chinensis var. chinensis]|uniref:Branchpoint-bridging protein n=1 Tax=Actinidia chinensis var. chinensis TaxID=1590841 RepID=A0A2R6RSW1_ACTCC|nr:Branchpoint-bridging protein [Actinidia chinensis var. chinensis]